MREIKFRAWDKDSQKLFYIVSIRGNKFCVIRDTAKMLSISGEISDKSSIVIMQYTGLKDKNGVDLDWWEGDVFKFADTSIDRIIFKDGCFWMWSDKYQFRQPLYKCIAWSESYTKIDNIHENPKLLNND